MGLRIEKSQKEEQFDDEGEEDDRKGGTDHDDVSDGYDEDEDDDDDESIDDNSVDKSSANDESIDEDGAMEETSSQDDAEEGEKIDARDSNDIEENGMHDVNGDSAIEIQLGAKKETIEFQVTEQLDGEQTLTAWSDPKLMESSKTSKESDLSYTKPELKESNIDANLRNIDDPLIENGKCADRHSTEPSPSSFKASDAITTGMSTAIVVR